MWFTEDAWSPIIVCIVVALICGIAWSTTQRIKYLIAAIIILLGAVTIHFVEQAIVTPSEQVEQNLYDLVLTFARESRELGGSSNKPLPDSIQCLRFFSVQDTVDRARVAAALLVADVDEDVRVTDVQIRMTNEDTRAITHFRANATVRAGSFSGHHASRWELTWQREGGEWKVTQTKMLNIINGSEQRIPQVD